MTLSALATFDDVRRCMQVLSDGTAEEEFLRFLRIEEKYRQECNAYAQEAQRIQKELDKSLVKMGDLEGKLFHARRIIDSETKLRRVAEFERDQMEKKIHAVADLLQHERNLNNETRDKLAFLHTLTRKRKSLNPCREDKSYNDINSTGSLLSDLSITQSEDDFLDVQRSKSWREHRPSLPKNSVPYVGSKRSRTSGGVGANTTLNGGVGTPGTVAGGRRSISRRSGVGVDQHTLDVAAGVERFCATTKVTIPQDGNGVIRAESTIESMPNKIESIPPASTIQPLNSNGKIGEGLTSTPRRSAFEEATAPPMTPVGKVLLQNGCGDGSPAQQRPMMRSHNFHPKTFLRGDTCAQCQKRMRFGAIGLRCRDCPVRCHVDCRYLLTLSCVPQSGTPTIKGMMGYLSDYAPNVAPMVPALIVHCINEIESRGLTEVGLYRVSATEREYKSLKEQFLRGKSTPHLANVDVHVLCGCVKDFLRSLREPLIPTCLWKDFSNAAQNSNAEESQKAIYKAIDAMPQPNRDTLAFLLMHFQRIAQCPAVLMPVDNIALVFGPTIVGNSSLDPDQHAIYTEVLTQNKVMSKLLQVPCTYWQQFFNLQLGGCPDKVGSQTPAVKRVPSSTKELNTLYATPLKSTMKKRKFYATPPYSHKK